MASKYHVYLLYVKALVLEADHYDISLCVEED